MSSTVFGYEPERVRRAVFRHGRRLESRVRRRFPTSPKLVECPVCGWAGPRFAPSYRPRRPNRICPGCQSSERYRAFELTLRELGPVRPGTRLLEVAPIGTIEGSARELGYNYTSIDLRSTVAQVCGDLCRLPFPDAIFDVVACFHVLEHIHDDRAAVAELARVVGIHGEALVIVPRNGLLPTTFENPDAVSADYERLYGQSDHVRTYGSDVVNRWRATGIRVQVQRWVNCFTAGTHRRAVLTGDDDRYWILSAAAHSIPRPTCDSNT